MILDHPLTRAQCICPICGGPKDVHLVACWPCWRVIKNGNAEAESALDAFEAQLEAMAAKTGDAA